VGLRAICATGPRRSDDRRRLRLPSRPHVRHPAGAPGSQGQGLRVQQDQYNPLGSADFVNPNFDVAYLEAWFAVDDKTPVILEVPEVKGRYYTAQILDEWGEVIANINERTFPSKPFGSSRW